MAAAFAHRSEPMASAVARLGRASVVARAPGRVNLIGEHTDYNDGFVFPMALPFETAVAGVMLDDGEHTVIDCDGFGTLTLPSSAGADDAWSAHLRGVHELLDLGRPLPRWRGAVATDIPTGASLSSSAALEVATTMVLLELAGERWSPKDVARFGQRVENDHLGLPSGIMDQLISACAVEGHATLIDCRDLSMRHVPLPDGYVVVVMDTQTRRELVDSEYAARRADCEAAARVLNVGSLRDASATEVEGLVDGRLRRRARHVVSENERTLAAADAMAAGDGAMLGQLMSESHRSLRDDYEVSGVGLDAIVEIASATRGCVGARMTGGGFAGCAVALVESEALDRFLPEVAEGYALRTGVAPHLWPVSAAGGATVERL